MKKITITRSHILTVTALWWGVFVLFSVTRYNPFQLLNIIGFLFLVIVPGALTLIALRLKGLEFWGYVSLALGLSLLELMLVGLLGNFFLPFVGITQPLNGPVILGDITLLTAVLLAMNWKWWRELKIPFKCFILFKNNRDRALALFPVIFVIMSIAGAIRLNNGASGILTLVMLIGMAVYCLTLIYYGKRAGSNVIPVALFFMSLSLLLMTSLRGWYTTGHDVQREFRVFELAKNNGLWSIAIFRDAYNACMSITILPTIFYGTLKFFDPYVYKVFFQIIFATVPGVLYLIARRYVSNVMAFISTLYFLSFPTFFSDMPFLNRQEIAFLLLALMVYILFEKKVQLMKRQILLVTLGIGMILSHYTTTYTVIALLLGVVIARPLFEWCGKFLSRFQMFRFSGVAKIRYPMAKIQPVISVWMVVALISLTFVWTNLLTNTASGSIYRVIVATINTMRSNAAEDVRSTDTTFSLFSLHDIDPKDLFAKYQKNFVDNTRVDAPDGTYYPKELYEQYQIDVTTGKIWPSTKLGQLIERIGFNASGVSSLSANFWSRFVQILLIIGFVVVPFTRRFAATCFDSDYMLLAIGSVLFVFSQIVLPVLSVEYGLFRAFLQALFFISIFIVIGSCWLFSGFRERAQVTIVGLIAVLFFVSSTGVVSGLLGGADPHLHLSNSGTYYDNYYVHESEEAGIDWLTENLKIDSNASYQSEVQSDRYSSGKLIVNFSPYNDIYPGLIRRDSYEFLGETNVKNLESSIFYQGTLITYTYPIQFLDSQKNLIYNNGNSRVYY